MRWLNHDTMLHGSAQGPVDCRRTGYHQVIRDSFRESRASPEELIATGEGEKFDLHGEYRGLRPLVTEINRAREAAGLTLIEVSRS